LGLADVKYQDIVLLVDMYMNMLEIEKEETQQKQSHTQIKAIS
jgi:hypothetical protein